MNICLLRIFCSNWCFAEKRTMTYLPSWLAQRFMHLSVCYLWMNAFSIACWALQMEPLWDSFVRFQVSWASVTTKMLLQRAQKMEVIWCKVRAVWWMFKTASSKLLQQGYHLLISCFHRAFLSQSLLFSD